MAEPLRIAKSDAELFLLPQMANRHGLIAGATGTGKTVTLQVLAEQFSRIGVPVFMADIKGDLSGISQPGTANEKLVTRLDRLGLDTPVFRGSPVCFWDLFGAQGHPVRTAISELGPLLLARMLSLNQTQEGVLTAVFKIADDNGLLLLDLADLRAMVRHVGEHARTYTTQYGNISIASVGAIQRGLLTLEQQGGERFFGEPELNLHDFLQTDGDGRGIINLLAADQLVQAPRLYAVFLLWLLAELFEQLPEVGDLEQPKLVFFFDEAHLLFDAAPKVLVDKIEQVVRLVRSKGVGVYFVTQNPLDLPDRVLGQLGNRIQHALRAYTPRDQKAVQAAAETFRSNPNVDVETAITELGVGEALVSLLDAQGRPTPVERALIVPPTGQIGPITAAQRQGLITGSVLYGHYESVVDRRSAYEILHERWTEQPSGGDAEPHGARGRERQVPPEGLFGRVMETLGTVMTGHRGRGRRQGVMETLAKSAARQVGNEVGRQLVRGVLGSLLGGRRR